MILDSNHLRMLAFIRLPVPPASNTNPTSPISGVAKSASPFAALNLVINGAWFVDTNAEAEMELNAKINEKIADFMLARVSRVPNKSQRKIQVDCCVCQRVELSGMWCNEKDSWNKRDGKTEFNFRPAMTSRLSLNCTYRYWRLMWLKYLPRGVI